MDTLVLVFRKTRKIYCNIFLHTSGYIDLLRAELWISGIVRLATDVKMRAESRIFILVETRWSDVASEDTMSFEEGDYVQSCESMAGSDSMEVLSAFGGRGADRRWCFGASCGLKAREETGRLSPPQSVTAFRLGSMVIGRCVPDLEFPRLLRLIAP